MSKTEQLEELLTRGIAAIYPTRDELAARLQGSKKVRIYVGIDPTGSDLHLGHLAQLLVLKRFQDLGHEVIMLMGDFTARIGDPTDKLSPRQPLTEATIKKNYRTYKKQASSVLRFAGTHAAKVMFNAKWLSKLSFADVTRLAQHVTVQQLLERDMFQERLRTGKPIGVHEFLYPLMQGYDSVAMKVDIELGGTDQTFNMLVGRTLEKAYINKDKFVMAGKLLADPTTGKKMSKTEGTYVTIQDKPEEIFGKVMAMPDGMIVPLAELCTTMPMHEVAALDRAVTSNAVNPRDAKLQVAEAVVCTIYDEWKAEAAREHFTKLFMKREHEDVAPALSVRGKPTTLDLVMLTSVAPSRSAAVRLIEQGAVSVAGRALRDPKEHPAFQSGDILKVGKRHYFRIGNNS
jgi:tyrosyl-tRNA synthetase